MPLTRPHYIDKAWPNAIDLRKAVGGYLPREGVLPDPITIASAGIAYANGTWNVGARPFVLASKRGGLPYTQTYGTALGTNDSAATAWVLGANASGSTRVDRLWVRFVDPTQAESLTTPGGETVARAVPVFGVTAGTPTIQPLPAGAVEIAQVSIPNAAASIAAATITQTYKFAQVVGGTIYVRTIGERDALTDLLEGDDCYVLNTDQCFEYLPGAPTPGWYHRGGVPEVGAFTPTGIYSIGSVIARALRQNGRVYLEGSVGSTSATFVAGTQYTIGSIPAAYAPDAAQRFACTTNGTATAEIEVDTAGTVKLRVSTGFTGGLNLYISGPSWPDKGLV